MVFLQYSVKCASRAALVVVSLLVSCRFILQCMRLQKDEDENGYIMIDELHVLADSLGLPIAPEERDEALEVVSSKWSITHVTDTCKTST